MKSISLREAFRVLETLFIRVYTQFSEKKQDVLVIPLNVSKPLVTSRKNRTFTIPPCKTNRFRNSFINIQVLVHAFTIQ